MHHLMIFTEIFETEITKDVCIDKEKRFALKERQGLANPPATPEKLRTFIADDQTCLRRAGQIQRTQAGFCLLWMMMDVCDNFGHARANQRVDRELSHGNAQERHERLWKIKSNGLQSRPKPCRHQHGSMDSHDQK
ncbi:MAG: hypothetical protein A2Z97_05630 [Bdellovibrionales bacterium GWB1_52_6]|nr:MAG: hypothetical protein A2Z97_05630 [Bdellovibrionales bacterium GWB1_52_6]